MGPRPRDTTVAGSGGSDAGATGSAGANDAGGADAGTSANEVRTLAQDIRGRFAADRPAVVAVTSRAGGKASLVVAVNAAARTRGVSAKDLVKGAEADHSAGKHALSEAKAKAAKALAEMVK